MSEEDWKPVKVRLAGSGVFVVGAAGRRLTAADHLEQAMAHLRALGVPGGEACEVLVLFDAHGTVRRVRVDSRWWPRAWSFGRRQLAGAESEAA